MKNHINVHPGELLREEFFAPMGITPYRLAKDAKLPHQRVNEILKEKRGITAETDLHFCAYFGQEPGYWLRVQLAYDLREANNTLGPKIRALVQPRAVEVAKLVAEGSSAKKRAKMIGLSVYTVKKQRTAMVAEQGRSQLRFSSKSNIQA